MVLLPSALFIEVDSTTEQTPQKLRFGAIDPDIGRQ